MSAHIIHSFTLLCLAMLSFADCQGTCPVRCLCHFSQQPRTVMCSKQGLELFPGNISDVVQHLDLSKNMLVEIPSDINRLIDLEYLNLARNQLTSLPDDLTSLKNLQRLDIADNKIYDVTDIGSISQLPSLTVLYVSGNPISILDGLASNVLQALDASRCDLRELGNKSLEGLPALATLSLARNPLKLIQKPSADKLRWLDMSDCLLNYLDPKTFSGFPKLEELRLANNPVLVFSTRYSTLEHSNLKKLDVSRCNLDRPGIHGFPALTHVRLSRNTIRMLPDRIFAKNRELAFLYLNSNGVEHLNASTFEGLVNLQVLDLSSNSLGYIHPMAFHENIELKLLNLSSNMLFEFPNLTSAVVSLDVSSNVINTLKRNALANMPKIRGLNLGDNKLHHIPKGLRSITLRNLNWKSNRLVQLENDSFLELPQLQTLDLSGNRLTEAMQPEVFRNNPNLATVKLGDNPWRCDCNQLYVTFEYLTSAPPKTASSSLVCQSPVNVSGYSWEAACYNVWNGPLYFNKDRTWGLVLISVLTFVVVFGSIVSIRHTMKIKRRALEQRQQLERAEVRERLRLLQRRNLHLEEELLERPAEPRIHPLELVGPPSYEEAVQMPRLAQSLNGLDEIGETGSVRMMGSVDNLRAKKRRTRRPRKRTQSEDDLLRREGRRQERLRRERNNSVGNICDSGQTQPENPRNSVLPNNQRSRRHSVADTLESASGKPRPRPQTPSAKKKKRRHTIIDGHSTDDEDSDVQALSSNRSIVIRELRREPRSGYRESIIERDS